MSERSPYDVLGVPQSATTRQIRAAYVERARRLHPDLVGLRGLDGMRELNEAWEVLKDAARRTAFDMSTGATSSAAAASDSPFGGDDPNRPFWTGAMGPAPGRPFGPRLAFGIYEGWTIGEIARQDRGYLVWLRDKPEVEAFRADIDKLIKPEEDQPSEPRRGWRR
ncbi:MAG TPA: DnaJ domain-containing protein [Candidatus Limnocylindrales bacterium]|nr:DnaJ domain-containing protein [Candidatus Limnocylindrales bacterium]